MFGELMRWNPSEELSSWHRDIDDLFGRFFGRSESPAGSWVPRMETYRKNNEYVVRLDLPGVDPERRFRSGRRKSPVHYGGAKSRRVGP